MGTPIRRLSPRERSADIRNRLYRLMAHMCILIGYLAIAVVALLLGWLLGANPRQWLLAPAATHWLHLALGGVSVLGMLAWLWKGHAMLARFAHRRIRGYLLRDLR